MASRFDQKVFVPPVADASHAVCAAAISGLSARIADEICVVKSLYTEAINHDPAITFIQTGSQLPQAGGDHIRRVHAQHGSGDLAVHVRHGTRHVIPAERLSAVAQIDRLVRRLRKEATAQ